MTCANGIGERSIQNGVQVANRSRSEPTRPVASTVVKTFRIESGQRRRRDARERRLGQLGIDVEVDHDAISVDRGGPQSPKHAQRQPLLKPLADGWLEVLAEAS